MKQQAQSITNILHGLIPTSLWRRYTIGYLDTAMQRTEGVRRNFFYDGAITLLINFKIVTSAPYKHDAITLLFTIVWHNRVATSYVTSSQNPSSPLKWYPVTRRKKLPHSFASQESVFILTVSQRQFQL